jgi:hypothetical protein
LAKGPYPKGTINMNLRWQLIIVVAVSPLLLSACASNQTPQPLPTEAIPPETLQSLPTQATPPETLRPLVVAAVSVDVGVGSPGLLEIVASGDWPDLCAQLAQVTSRIDGTNINISLSATAADPSCPPDYLGVPFRIGIPLNPVQLPEGTYTATVNSISTSFVWPQQ